MRRKSKVLLIVAIVVLIISPLFVFSYCYFLDGLLAPTVKVVPVRGVISVYNGASSQRIAQQIASADSDSSVKAILLEINSPGGYIVATEEISRAVEACDKPVVAWIREEGASGAYWVASSADLIVAEPASITGSIGVTASYLQYAGLLEKYGITYERLVTGKYKDMGSPYKELSSSERTMLQSKINVLNEQFIGHVSRARGMSESNVRALATGEIFLGSEALENGLVDQLGDKQAAFEAAKELSGAEDASLDDASYNGFLEGFLSTSAYWFGRGIADGLITLSEQVNKFTA